MSLNVKYEDLSVVGKVWTIREELNKGIINNDAGFIMSANKKLNEIVENKLYSTIYENDKAISLADIADLVENAKNIKKRYVDGEEVSTYFQIKKNANILLKIWKCREILDHFKFMLKKSDQTKEDVVEFEKMTDEIYKLYRKSHKEQEISKVKRDFYKIYIEVVDAHIKYENRKREYNEYMS